MRTRPPLSGNARLAILMWLIALGTSAAIVLVASAARAEAAFVASAPPNSFTATAVVMLALATIMAVLGLCIALNARHPRGGL